MRSKLRATRERDAARPGAAGFFAITARHAAQIAACMRALHLHQARDVGLIDRSRQKIPAPRQKFFTPALAHT